jgi:D-alanyl-D-alanine carboxypeptidase
VDSTRRAARAGVLAAALGILVSAARLAAASPEVVGKIDRIFAEAYPPAGPGAAVLVVQDGRPVLRKGYGMAEIELGVPISPDMVFRVGSVTKQFTAAAILKLAEEGRLSLDDSLTKWLPDFPTGGRRVTLGQLLTHTSGIHSYTDMPAWQDHMREDWTLQQLEDFFRQEPFDFEPGTKWHYDNSGYILLGAVLEKATGKTYADLLDDMIFRPLGMKDTRYGSDAPIIPGRVAGYQKLGEQIVNARFLSMTQPFAAGALVSTVDDLARWQAALDAGRVLRPESLRRMWTAARLPDGTDTHYGYGWIIWRWDGRAVVEHGGGINGFQTANLRLPDDGIYVAVLSNCGGCADPRTLALRAATTLVGKPFGEQPAARIDPERLDKYAGTYQDSDGGEWTVTREDGHLRVAAGSRTWDAWPASDTDFFFRDAVRTLRFVVAPDGAVTAMEIDEHVGPVDAAKRIEAAARP